MPGKSRKIKVIFIVYWILLLYVLSALIWWYIALTRQNNELFDIRRSELKNNEASYHQRLMELEHRRQSKTAQYLGEGAIFFLLIGAGAIFLYRGVKKQLKLSEQQQNFMMAVTHELKTPIAVTKLNLETLQKRKLDEVQYKRLLQNTMDEANRMNALCSNLLLSSQMESGKYHFSSENIMLADLLQECIRDFKNRFPERALKLGDLKNEQIQGDPFLLQIVIHNLLNNAHQYSGKDQPIKIDTSSNQHQVGVIISDHGKGIPNDEKKKVFEKYYRIGSEDQQNTKGTGLGLYLVKRIIDLMQAEIHIADNQPSGAKFVLLFKSIDT